MTLRRILPLLALGVCHLLRADDHLALLGTYTGESKGIYAVHLDDATGALSTPQLVAELANPEFLALSSDGRFVYALTQVPGADGQPAGAVAAFAVDRESGHLTRLDTESTGRTSLTHLAIDGSGRELVAASYNGGYVVSFPVGADGRVGPAATVLTEEGPLGPNRARQDASHAHSVTISPDSRFAFVANLGLDRIFSYRLKAADGTIAPNDPPFATMTPGTGPRHTKFSPDGKFFYVLDELDGTVTACRYDAAAGVVTPLQRSSTLPEDFRGKNTASEIRIRPDGRFVYTANRGHNSLAVFARDPESGALTRVEIVPSGGDHPRNFALTPDGAWLLCAHMNTNNLTVFRVDPATGRLTATPHAAQVAKAVCVLFLR